MLSFLVVAVLSASSALSYHLGPPRQVCQQGPGYMTPGPGKHFHDAAPRSEPSPYRIRLWRDQISNDGNDAVNVTVEWSGNVLPSLGLTGPITIKGLLLIARLKGQFQPVGYFEDPTDSFNFRKICGPNDANIGISHRRALNSTSYTFTYHPPPGLKQGNEIEFLSTIVHNRRLFWTTAGRPSQASVQVGTTTTSSTTSMVKTAPPKPAVVHYAVADTDDDSGQKNKSEHGVLPSVVTVCLSFAFELVRRCL